MNVIEFKRVSKKFRKGEKINSLRDFVPNLVKGLLPWNKEESESLQEKEFWALKDVSFEVKKGDFLGIIGPNGAGKSTILKLLSRIMFPNEGKINIKGNLSALIEVTAGFHPDLTGRENIYLNGTILGMSKKYIENKYEQIVEFSGIKEFIDTPIKRYSTGMYSRLGFSVAAHMSPDILLVDEVLAVGDIAFQAKCARKMRELLNSGVTIVFVSHNIALVQSLCKRVILLNKGEISKEGVPEDVLPYYQNIIYQQEEEEIKSRTAYLEGTIKPKEERIAKILDVFIHDGKMNKKETFKVKEPISLKIDCEAKEVIVNPVFVLDIMRGDGVVCCSLNSKYYGFEIGNLQGKFEMDIGLGTINLGPGIYILECSIWDKDMIHPYNFRKKDILKVEIEEGKIIKSNCVFIPQVEWSLRNINKNL